MAVEPHKLRPDDCRTGSTTDVRFDEATGSVIRRRRLFDEERLASESIVAYPAVS